MSENECFSEESSRNELLEAIAAAQRRRWHITVFQAERVEGGGTRNVIFQQFDNVRSDCLAGTLMDNQGVLRFLDANGKKIIVSSLPFIARELDPASD